MSVEGAPSMDVRHVPDYTPKVLVRATRATQNGPARCAGPSEEEWDGADRAVALLADDDLGLPLDRRVLEHAVLALRVDLLAEEEHDEVRVLLDGAGLAQVGEHGTPALRARTLVHGT